MLIAAIITTVGLAQDGGCQSEQATAAYRRGFEAQQRMETDTALAEYRACLEADPACVACTYEIGWSHWSRSDYENTVAAWEKTLSLDPNHGPAQAWLPQAQNQASGGYPLAASGLRVPIGLTSREESRLSLSLVARFQNYNARPAHPEDRLESLIYSPKSVQFLPDGKKVYVNSLEGYTTAVFDPRDRTRVGAIRHDFGVDDEALFHSQTSVFDYPYRRRAPDDQLNVFKGKPVEQALSHDGRFLWVPYYRRSWDYGGTSPSAVAIIDTTNDEVVRVMPTGPIPKYVVASPDGKWVAITHWGDNTLGIIDVSSGDPATFRYLGERLIVETALDMSGLASKDRDAACGFCLRGTVFTPDSSVLLVARMGGGGIAGFDVATWKYLGTVTGEKPTPRHLTIGPDKETLFLSSNKSGHVSRIALSTVLKALENASGRRVEIDGWTSRYVGGSARTIALSPDGSTIYTAVNSTSQLVALDATTLDILARVRTDSYTVGLAVSPDGTEVWTTSQGKNKRGGNSVCIYAVAEHQDNGSGAAPLPDKTP